MTVQVLVSRVLFASALVAMPTIPAPQAADHAVSGASPPSFGVVRAKAPAPGEVSRLAARLAFPTRETEPRSPVRRTVAVAPSPGTGGVRD